MNCFRLIGLIIAVTLTLSAKAPSQTTDQLITQLEHELNTINRFAPTATSAIRAALQQQRYTEAQQQVANIAAATHDFPQINSITEQLSALISTQVLNANLLKESTTEKALADATTLFLKNAPASAFDEPLAQLAKLGAGRDYADATSQKVEIARQFIVKCQDYTVAKAAGNLEASANVLRELTEIATRVPNIPRSQLLALQNAAPKAQEDTAYLTLAAELSGLLDTTQKPEDLDPFIHKLAQTFNPERYSPNQRKIESLRRIAKKWQDYFADVSSNDPAAARVLNELLSDTEMDAIYPRSKILSLAHGQATVSLLRPDQVTTETLDEFCHQLRSIPANSSISTTTTRIDALQATAAQLNEAAAQLKAGNPQPTLGLTQNFPLSSGEYAAAFDQIKQKLLNEAVAFTLNTPEVKPGAKATLQSYLDQVIVFGRDHKDWALVQRAINAQNYLPPDQRNSVDLQTYAAFFTAQNLEKAEDWTNAIRYYQAAIRSTSLHAPSEEAGARLKALKAGHPSEYEEASKLGPLDTTPTPRLPPNFGGWKRP